MEAKVGKLHLVWSYLRSIQKHNRSMLQLHCTLFPNSLSRNFKVHSSYWYRGVPASLFFHTQNASPNIGYVSFFSLFEEAAVAERERRHEGSSRCCFFRSGRPDTVWPSWSAYRHDNPFFLAAAGWLSNAAQPRTAETEIPCIAWECTGTIVQKVSCACCRIFQTSEEESCFEANAPQLAWGFIDNIYPLRPLHFANVCVAAISVVIHIKWSVYFGVFVLIHEANNNELVTKS